MLIYLNGLFVGLLVLSNIISVKLFSIGEIILPAAAIVYVFTYLITDVIGEVYGREIAVKTVRAGFFTQILASLFILAAIYLPSANAFDLQAEFALILGGSFRVILASLAAYLVSQHLDVTVFHKLKEKHGRKKLWLRNTASTMFSQLIDTSIFIVVAFLGVVPNHVLIGMIVTQYLFKFLVAIVDTPFVYLLVGIARKEKPSSLPADQTNIG
ncbi:queuosine precursor transporter [Amphibacillus sediminis]|uniref:queuosine precursor transporter n=1 Tax=Amphibacillus sediminis TaxID=360185 RepID=UPI00082B80B3|nr:queuosine precursor transporter [Amphibacillus sediminis]